MAERLKNYIAYIEKRAEEPLTAEERALLKEDLLTQIAFFQHERLIHLIVTVTFALLTILIFLAALIGEQSSLWLLLLPFLILLLPYLAHYYKLENGVQRLYKSYDRLTQIVTSPEESLH